jgi:hypothetical protein
MKKGEFKLYITNFLPESIFCKMYGNEAYVSVAKSTANRGYCSACGHEPKNTQPNQSLQLHIYEVNKQNPGQSKAVVLCAGCHATQHIEHSITNNWVKFVNSSLSQETLVTQSRYGNFLQLYADSKIVDLKKTPEQVLEEIRSGAFKISSTLKVIFTNSFVFNDF